MDTQVDMSHVYNLFKTAEYLASYLTIMIIIANDDKNFDVQLVIYRDDDSCTIVQLYKQCF